MDILFPTKQLKLHTVYEKAIEVKSESTLQLAFLCSCKNVANERSQTYGEKS